MHWPAGYSVLLCPILVSLAKVNNFVLQEEEYFCVRGKKIRVK